MQSDALLQLAVDALDDLKAQDVKVMDVRELTDMTDYMIIASGRSGRQVAAMAEHLTLTAKSNENPALGVEGLDDAQWVLVDLCDVVVHIMQPETRDEYQLEKLWAPRAADTTGDTVSAPTHA